MMTVIDTLPEHLLEYLKDARAIDLEEVKAASGCSFQDHLPFLLSEINNLKTLIDTNTGQVLGIGGLYRGPQDNIGIVWLLLTYSIEKRKIEFLKFSKMFLRSSFFDPFEYLTNMVYKKNALHMAWLTWLGAKWIEENDHFSLFIISRKEL